MWIERARTAADEWLRTTAGDVDAGARFPHESVDALREADLLSVQVPSEMGGGGIGFQDLGRIVEELARACASTALIYSMHQIQVSCLIRHAPPGPLQEYLARLSDASPLLASVTSEVGTEGDIRMSLAALESRGKVQVLEKHAAVVSYGESADAFLITARRSPEDAPEDQVLVLCERPDVSLEKTGNWNTIGLRGTCSPPFKLRAAVATGHVFPQHFGEILSQTMLPVSHALWSSVWLGMATEVFERARAFVQNRARRSVGKPRPEGARLAELAIAHQQLTALVHAATRRLDDAAPEEFASINQQIESNSLKVAASNLLVEIVGKAMLIIGVAGYRTDGEYSLDRLLRDSFGANVMVNNDRILASTSQLLLVSRS